MHCTIGLPQHTPLCHGWTTFDSTYSFSQRFKLSFVNMGLAYYVLSPGGFSRFATYPGVFFFRILWQTFA